MSSRGNLHRPRVTPERIAAMQLYSTRSRDALTQRLDILATKKAGQLSGRRLSGDTQGVETFHES